MNMNIYCTVLYCTVLYCTLLYWILVCVSPPPLSAISALNDLELYTDKKDEMREAREGGYQYKFKGALKYLQSSWNIFNEKENVPLMNWNCFWSMETISKLLLVLSNWPMREQYSVSCDQWESSITRHVTSKVYVTLKMLSPTLGRTDTEQRLLLTRVRYHYTDTVPLSRCHIDLSYRENQNSVLSYSGLGLDDKCITCFDLINWFASVS